MALAGPLANRRPFFGWYLVFLAFQAQLMSWGFYFTLTYFIGPMTADLGWSATEFSTVQLLNNLSFSVVLPFLGRYLDRYGGRTFMIVGGVIGACGIASVAWVNQIWQFYLLMGILVPIAMAMYGSIVAGVALANWFHRKRGRAFALASMGTSAGGVTFGPLASYLIGTIGWRETWLVMAGIVLVGITVPAFLFMSRRPEDVGLLPDGDAPEISPPPVRGQRVAPPAPAAVATWTRGEAMRTPAFWLIVLSFAMSNLVIGAFLLHVFPFLISNGFTSSQATLIAVCFSTVLVAAKPFYGIALERWPARRVAFASFLLSGVMIAAMVVLRQPAFLILAVMVYGIGMSGSIPIEDVAWADYFGRWSIGTIRGAAFPIESLLGSAGPIIGAVAYDATGGYSGAFVIFAIAYSAASLGILAAQPPKWRSAPAIPVMPAMPMPAATGARAYAGASARAVVSAALNRADSGARQAMQQPRVQRGASALVASVVGLAAGLMVTLLSAPPVKRVRKTENAPLTNTDPAPELRPPAAPPGRSPGESIAAQTLRGMRRDGQALVRLGKRLSGRG